MLTEHEKEIVRLMICARPTPEYMEQLATSDEFARSEIASFVPAQLTRLAGLKNGLEFQLSSINSRLAKVQADLDLLNQEGE